MPSAWVRGMSAVVVVAVVVALAMVVGIDAIAKERGDEPLRFVADVPLPGRPTRFDYLDLDPATRHLALAHMGDDEVVVVDTVANSVLGRVRGLRSVRGVVVAPEANLILATVMSDELVRIDATRIVEIDRVPTGRWPDGLAWDAKGRFVAVSDQRDGAVSIVADAGKGKRRQVKLGQETGNVVADERRGAVWAAVSGSPADRLVAIDVGKATVSFGIDLPGCKGAHGVRLHPDGRSAYVACEDNHRLARVDLETRRVVDMVTTDGQPDVLAVDAGLARLYVAAENGRLTVVDTRAPGVAVVGRQTPGPRAHVVAVDPASHRVFFPLPAGPAGTPVLRIMQP